MKKVTILILFALLMTSLSSCKVRKNEIINNNEYISDNQFLLDTIVTIKIYDDTDKAIFEDLFAYIKELENILSVHIEGSDLWNLQENAGKQWTEVSLDTIKIIEKSIEISEMSQGFFDITSGPLIKLWAIDPPKGYYPTNIEIQEALALIDYKKIEIDKARNRIFLKDMGMEGNLGAIAKGYISDKVKEYLLEKGINRAIINLGGNVLVIGNKQDGSDFKIGIQDPDGERGKYLGAVNVSDKSVVSSGTYERYFVHEGKAYHHIFNPFTGFPQENRLKGVSIISDHSTEGDAFSTAVFLMGIDKGMKLVESMDGIDVIFITKDNKLYISSGISNIFELELESGYSIANP